MFLQSDKLGIGDPARFGTFRPEAFPHRHGRAAQHNDFIGQKQRGVWGGIFATLGMVFPSLVIITALAGLITNFAHVAWVQHAFAGIRVVVCVLIFNAVVKLWKSAVHDVWGALLFAAVLAATLLTSLSPVVYVLLSAAAGIVIQSLQEGRK